MIYQLLESQHPLVHMKMSGESEPEDKVEFSKDMAETMRHWGGIGLSANQVGFPYRMFVMGDNDNYINCWNPRILVESDNKVAIQEGCLTYPGLFVKIFRPDWIEVEFEDENGETHQDTFEGLMCRVFQHEMDHMQGKDFRDHVSKLKLNMAIKRMKKQQKKLDILENRDSSVA